MPQVSRFLSIHPENTIFTTVSKLTQQGPRAAREQALVLPLSHVRRGPAERVPQRARAEPVLGGGGAPTRPPRLHPLLQNLMAP